MALWPCSFPLKPKPPPRVGASSTNWETAASIEEQIPELKALARDGWVLMVWVREESQHRCPNFQFDGQTQLIPQMKSLLELLRGPSGLTDEANQSGWLEVEWLYCPHVLLDGKSPAECSSTNPEVVMEAAREEFAQDFDSRW